MRRWRVGDVMTRDVVTVRPDTPYREIVDILSGRRVSAVPVVDERNHVLGVVSEADLLHKIEFNGEAHERLIFAGRRRRYAQAKAHGDLARDLMTAPAITTVPDTSIAVAAKLMDDEQVKRLPVVERVGEVGGELGRLVGIVSRADLLRVYLRPDVDILREVVDEVLRRTLWVEPDAVTTEVRDGVVTLTGRVDRRSTAELAVKLSHGVGGVVEVVDRLGFEFDDRDLSEARRYGPNPFGTP